MALKLNERYPGRFNNPTTQYPQGSFKNRTSPSAKDGSYLEQDWANDKEGFFQSLLAKAGFVADGLIDKVGSSQYYDALLKTVSSFNYAADTGTANVYAAAFTPPITALTDGTVVRVKIKTANSGASTFNPNGLGAKPIVGSAHAALQGGELVANGHAWLQYNSSLSGGSWVILASSGGAQQVASASKSAQAVNLSQLGNYSGYLSASANLTLTSTALGKVVFGDATGVVITLPAGQQLEGSAITIVALSDCTVAATAGGSIRIGSTVNNSMSLLRGEQLTLFTAGISVWYVASYSKTADVTLSMFTGGNQSLGVSGFQKLPGGLIRQWGYAEGLSGYTITLPTAFPNGVLGQPIACCVGTASATPGSAAFAETSKVAANSFKIFTYVPASGGGSANAPRAVAWECIGY